MNVEWLRTNALFRCERCEDGFEYLCHPAADLRLYQGKTCCENCYSDIDIAEGDPAWDELPAFDPFAVEKTE